MDVLLSISSTNCLIDKLKEVRMSIDRKALFTISYGLYVVSSSTRNEKSGFIGNTVFQITSKPPKVAIGVSRDNHTHGVIVDSGFCAVTVLNQNADPALIQTFGYQSSRDIDKFAKAAWRQGENGSPVVTDGANACFECSVIQRVELATHDIFICEITSSELFDTHVKPLTYEHYRSVMKGKAPKNAPTFVDESSETRSDSLGSGETSVCSVCQYEYVPEKGDPEHGVAPGTPFDALPPDWKCPICGSPKEVFAER
jgi:flavin reductase (DIM6/NTAB) family NADH-FMN oxidoreductase RutF/rubredoxin